MVSRRPPKKIVPAPAVPFGSVVKVTVREPVPPAPEVIVIQEASERADQPHPAGAVTVIEPAPPEAGIVREVGLRGSTQALTVIVNAAPPAGPRAADAVITDVPIS